MAEPKQYLVEYLLTGNATELTKTLKGIQTLAEGVNDSITGTKNLLRSAVANDKGFTSLMEKYDAMMEKYKSLTKSRTKQVVPPTINTREWKRSCDAMVKYASETVTKINAEFGKLSNNASEFAKLTAALSGSPMITFGSSASEIKKATKNVETEASLLSKLAKANENKQKLVSSISGIKSTIDSNKAKLAEAKTDAQKNGYAKLIEQRNQELNNLQAQLKATKDEISKINKIKKEMGKTPSSSTKNVAKNISSIVGSTISKAQDKINERTIQIRPTLLAGELGYQMSMALGSLQKHVNDKRIVIKPLMLISELGYQLNISLANLQRLADSHPIIIRSVLENGGSLTVNSGTPSPANVATTQPSQKITKTIINTIKSKGRAKTSIQSSSVFMRQANLADRLRAKAINAMSPFANSASDIKTLVKYRKFFNSAIVASGITPTANMDTATKLSYLNQVSSQMQNAGVAVPWSITNQINKLNAKLAAADLSGETKEKLYTSSTPRTSKATRVGGNKNALTPANIGRETAKAISASASKEDFYTKARRLSYPFTGNTSFGARSPMAVEMAKGMGMMFAVSGIMSAVSDSFRQASEYENVMKTVKAILQTNDNKGAFTGRFGLMESTIRKVGRETKFTAPEVAGAARFMAMAGLGIEDINAATMPIANLALVGDNDLSTTADKMTNIMTSFGLLKGLTEGQKKANMVHTSDVLTNTFTKSNTDLIQLAEAMQYAGPMSHLTGTALEDAAAMVGVMGNAGIQSSMAGTTLRMMYQNIIKPNKKQAEEWDRLGINRTDGNGRVRDIFEILKDLRAKITGTTDLNSKIGKDQLKDMGAEVMQLFRTTAGAGTAALLENLGEAINLAQSNREANGVAAKIADEKKNTIQGLWAQVTSTFTDQSVNTVSKFTNTIKDMLIKLRDWLSTQDAADTLKNIYDMGTSILEVFRWVAKAWKWVYDVFGSTSAKFLIGGQLIMTQLGYLITPFVQLTGVISSLGKTIANVLGISGVSIVSGVASTAASRIGAITSASSGYIPTWNRNLSGGRTSGTMSGLVAGTLLSGSGMVMPFHKYSGRTGAILSGGASQASKYAEYRRRAGLWATIALSKEYATDENGRVNWRDWRYKFNDAQRESLLNRSKAYMRAASEANMMRKEAIMSAASTRHAGRMASVSALSRGVQMGKFSFASASGAALNAGMMAGAFRINPFHGIISTLRTLSLGLVKAIGFILSPLGMLGAGLAAVVGSIWYIHNKMDKIREQYRVMANDMKVISDTQSDYRNAKISSVIGAGFRSASFGYNKTVEEMSQAFSLQDNPLAASLMSDGMKDIDGLRIAKQYVSAYSNILPDNMVNEFFKNNSHKGIYNDKVNENARKFGLIAQWASMAVGQKDVQQAMIDMNKALYIDNDNAKVQKILESFMPSPNAPRMSNIATADDIYNITSPQKFYEWQNAQYKALKELMSDNSPIRQFANAVNDLKNIKNIKDVTGDMMSKIGRGLIGGVPVEYNNQKAFVTFDKLGRVDWIKLSETLNNGIPFNIQQQMELLQNIYDSIYNDPNISSLENVVSLLKEWLPKLAKEQNPYTKYEFGDTWNDPNLPGNKKMQIGQNGTVSWDQFKVGSGFGINDSFGRSVANNNGSVILGDIEDHIKHPEKYGIKTPSSASSATETSENNGGNNVTDQSAYDSKYNRSAARPTQIIFNIDQLCKFDNTKISESSEKQQIVEAVETKVAAVIQEIFQQAASEFALIGNA